MARVCVQALSDRAEQCVLCYDHQSNKQDSVDEVDGVNVYRCATQITAASQPLSRTYGHVLEERIRRFRPDVVIFHYPNPYAAAFLLRYLPEGTRLILYWHLDIVRQKILRVFFEGQNQRLLKRADCIIATSPNYIEGSRWLMQYREKCRVLPNCIDEEHLKYTERDALEAERIHANPDKIICLAVGRHVTYKGLNYLIQASARLDDRFEIRIAGTGPMTDELKQLAEGNPKIRFLGLVDQDQLKENLLACDIFCFPSVTRNEAFGIALAEAMYYGKPVVTFTIDGSGVNYVNINGVTGVEVPNADAEAYAQAMKRLADSKELREKYGRAARQRAVDNFLFSSYKQAVNEIFDELGDRR